MAKNVLDGRKIASNIKGAIKRELRIISGRGGRRPGLAALQVGSNPCSDLYLGSQKFFADELGVDFYVKCFKSGASQESIEREIERLNKDKGITGIIVHTPVPRHINAEKLFAKIALKKDVEGLSPASIGRLIHGKSSVSPCTAGACMTLIESTGVDLSGKEAVIVGHSEIVGKPLALMLLSKLATTTVCHIGTYRRSRLKEHVKRAEILVVSVGKPNLIKGSWVRRGAIVIDVGINRYRGGITGDVDFKEAVKRASYITPVPGGVGPLTTVMLIKNLITLYKRARGSGK